MTCPGCSRPLEPGIFEVRTYHTQCDPQGRVEMLERLMWRLINSAEDYDVRLDGAVEAARAALTHRPAQMKGGEGDG